MFKARFHICLGCVKLFQRLGVLVYAWKILRTSRSIRKMTGRVIFHDLVFKGTMASILHACVTLQRHWYMDWAVTRTRRCTIGNIDLLFAMEIATWYFMRSYSQSGCGICISKIYHLLCASIGSGQ